jgi:hypothetical protein
MKKRQGLYLGVGLGLLFISSFLYPSRTEAQSVGIKISPVVLDELVEPGDTIARQVKVTNEAPTSRTFYAYLRDFTAEGETGAPRLLPPGTDQGFSIASWIDISGEGIEFGPGEEKVIDYYINIPAEAGPGGYRGAILFGTEPPRIQVESEDKGAGMSVAQQTASLVLLQVKGDVDERASIREFNTDKDFYGTPYNVDFLVRVENTGNVHVKPHGTVMISNMFGKEVAMVRVNEQGGNILPGTIRRFLDVRWEGKNAFGKYTATLGLTYGTPTEAGGQGKSSMVGTKTFWIIPWRIIVPAFVSLLITILLMVLFLRTYKNRAVRMAMERAGVTNLRQVKKYQSASPSLHLGMVLLASFIIMFLVFSLIYVFFIA